MNRAAAAFSLAMTVSLVLIPRSASAKQGIIEGLKAVLDLSASSVSTTTTTASGTLTTKTDNVFPRLTLNMDSLLYPKLRLTAGGVFEVNASSFALGGGGQDTAVTRLTPFFQLRSTDRLFSPGIGYHRRETRTRTAGAPEASLVSEDYTAYLGWRPEGLPRSEIQFVRTNTFDGERAFRDVTKNFVSILSRYTKGDLGINYRGSYLGNADRLMRFETHLWSNGARVDYTKAFLAKRLLWTTTYNIDRQDLTVMTTGEGDEVAIPISPYAGLSTLSDTPVSGTLSQNPLLIDGNLTASAGLNLGLPALGADAQARNIGLDFLNPTRVDRLLVWIDRELPVEVANAFSWEIYSSEDNLVWRREAVLSAAPFGPFENRFELDFPSVTVRYLKAVTRPLSPVLPDASRFPDIFVTEMQAFVRRSADGNEDRLGRTSQILNTDVRLLILHTPSLYYEGSYWFTEVHPDGQTRNTLSNGVSVRHRFNPIVAVFGRGALEQGTQREGFRTATVQNASLTLTPIPTFTGSVIYSGLDERIEDTLNDRKSLVFQTSTQLYRGVDLQVGGGWIFTTNETGEDARSDLLNVTASLVPRSNLTLTVTYTATTTTRSGTFSGAPKSSTGRTYLTVAYDPIRTLRLVAGEEVITGLGGRTRTTHDIGANWSPFPDGALQFIFTYDEALRALEFGKERVLRSGVRWNLSRRSYIDVSYQTIKSELVFQTTRTKILSAGVKLFL